ncbi:MAG TPA: ATP-binding protein [Thermoanaerobaculia bacterium]|nr:ATP-binding protein [Thermoanaerobaculia bacterium]
MEFDPPFTRTLHEIRAREEPIFDPYFSTHDTGTGLGLPIARRIAEEHGGGITARNRAEGGLEVAITLPIQ